MTTNDPAQTQDADQEQPTSSLHEDHTGRLRFTHRTETGPGSSINDPDLHLVQKWITTAHWTPLDPAGGETDPERLIGFADWQLVDLTEGVEEAWDHLDSISGDDEGYGSALVTMTDDTGELDPDEPAALILNYVRAPKPDRGSGIGRLILHEAVRVAAGFGRPEDMAVLCRPQPEGWDTMTPPEHAAALARLQEAWKVLGFRPVEADPDFYATTAHTITHADLTGVLAPPLARAVEHFG